MFHDQVDAAFAGEAADLGRPGGPRVERGLRPELRRTGGVWPRVEPVLRTRRAEAHCDLDRRRTDAAGPADHQHPVARLDLGPVGQHVHGRAAGQGQRSRGLEARRRRASAPARRWHGDLFGEPAIAVHAEHTLVQADRFLAAPADTRISRRTGSSARRRGRPGRQPVTWRRAGETVPPIRSLGCGGVGAGWADRPVRTTDRGGSDRRPRLRSGLRPVAGWGSGRSRSSCRPGAPWAMS